MATLYRYYWKSDDNTVGNEVAGFESFERAQEQVDAWSQDGWEFSIAPQEGIELPEVMDSPYNASILYSNQVTGQRVVSAISHFQGRDSKSSLENWQCMFARYDEEFDQSLLAPELGAEEVAYFTPALWGQAEYSHETQDADEDGLSP